MIDIHPATPDRLADLASLFGTNGTTRGCWCTYFLTTSKEFSSGWGRANRARFERVARAEPPAGLLAYQAGEPVGWCAAGPRARYSRALRSPVLKGREADEDTSVWLVPCFFVRRDARHCGVTRQLLEAAVQLAADHGATAVEGFPRAGDTRLAAGDAYLGAEPVFAACGFTVVSRPTPKRVVMRRDLATSLRPRSGPGTGARPGR